MYHPETRTILNVLGPQESEGDFCLEASKVFCDQSLFKFVDAKNTNMGYDIEYESAVFLKSDKHESYIVAGVSPISSKSLNPSDSFTRTTADFPQILPRRNVLESVGDVFEPTLSENPVPGKVMKFLSSEEFNLRKDNIINGDYVRIRCDNKWLTFYAYPDKRGDCYFERIEDRYQSMNYSSTIFQIIKGNNGGPVSVSDKYYIRHLVTGAYLTKGDSEGFKALYKYPGSNNENEEPTQWVFETKVDDPNVREKAELKIKSANEKACIQIGTPAPIPNVQLEKNTVYYFGFNLPEEYTFKNLKNLTRFNAITQSDSDYNIVLERVDPKELEDILYIEGYANRLQHLIDIHDNTASQVKMKEVQVQTEKLFSRLYSTEKLNSSGIEAEKTPYKLKIPRRYIQTLLRELRVFDLVHIITFLAIKKGAFKDCDTTLYSTLYNQFIELVIAGLFHYTPNRFYNSQFIRVYIHSLSVGCHANYSYQNLVATKNSMRYKTLELLKELLWDEDLDGLGQLNYYTTTIFGDHKANDNYETYFLELTEHISNSRAYNLVNTFRDQFVETFMVNEPFNNTFPIFTRTDGQIQVRIRNFIDEGETISLFDLPANESKFKYFRSSMRLLIALSSCKLIPYYQQIIKHYPLIILQDIVKEPEYDISIRTLCHLVLLYGYFNYVKLPFQCVPPTIQTSSEHLREILNQEETRIQEACKTVIGADEKSKLEQLGILEAVENNITKLNTSDFNTQISLVQVFSDKILNPGEVLQAIEYITRIIENGNMNIVFLNKAKEALAKVRTRCTKDEEEDLLPVLPQVLQTLTLINQKMRIHSTNAIYTQVIKAKHPNAEEQARKIIGGLRKIQYESISPLDILGLNEPIASENAIKSLKDITAFEETVVEDLDKFVILSSEKDVKDVRDAIEIALTLNQHLRNYRSIKATPTTQLSINYSEGQKIIELIEKLLLILYNPEEHFRFKDDHLFQKPSKSPKERFIDALQAQKTQKKDPVFKTVTSAVSKLQQSIFALLSLHDILLQTLHTSLYLTMEGKPDGSQWELYLIRLCIVVLIVFCHKNIHNQNLLVNSQAFVSLYYAQHYINQSADSLTLFAEVMRDNEELLEVTKKFIYDITWYTFLGTIKPREINNNSESYLTAAISSLHYLSKANIPKVTFDAYEIGQAKLNQIFKNTFEKLDILNTLKSNDDITFPGCYYNIREMLESLCGLIRDSLAEEKTEGLKNFRKEFTVEQFITGLCTGTYVLQFELKNLIVKLFKKMHVSKRLLNPAYFDEHEFMIKRLIGYLLIDIMEFFITSSNDQKAAEDLYQLALEKAFIEKYRDSQEAYKELRKYNLKEVFVTIHHDRIPIELAWRNLYVYGDAITTISKIGILYPKYFLTSGLIELYLKIVEFLATNADLSNYQVLFKIKKHLVTLSEMPQYEKFLSSIKSALEVVSSNYEGLAQKMEIAESQKQENIVDDPAEKIILRSIVEHMRSGDQKDELNNIDQICNDIKSHNKKYQILTELLTVLESNPCDLHKNYYTHVATVINTYIKRTLPHADQANLIYDSAYNNFYEVQEELTQLDAETKLTKALTIVANNKNLFALVEAILNMMEGFNSKVLEKFRNGIDFVTSKTVTSLDCYKTGANIVGYILDQLYEKSKDQTSCAKIVDYCRKSHSLFHMENKDIAQSLSSQSYFQQNEEFNAKLQAFSEKGFDAEEGIKELGPVPITFHTIAELFRKDAKDGLALTVIKNNLIEIVRTSDIHGILSAHFRTLINNKNESLFNIRNEIIVALDVWISRIKGTIVKGGED